MKLNILLNNPGSKEKVLREILNYLSQTKMKIIYQNVWNAAKAVLRRKFMALNNSLGNQYINIFFICYSQWPHGVYLFWTCKIVSTILIGWRREIIYQLVQEKYLIIFTHSWFFLKPQKNRNEEFLQHIKDQKQPS